MVKKVTAVTAPNPIEHRILMLRGQRVLLGRLQRYGNKRI